MVNVLKPTVHYDLYIGDPISHQLTVGLTPVQHSVLIDYCESSSSRFQPGEGRDFVWTFVWSSIQDAQSHNQLQQQFKCLKSWSVVAPSSPGLHSTPGHTNNALKNILHSNEKWCPSLDCGKNTLKCFGIQKVSQNNVNFVLYLVLSWFIYNFQN